MTRGPGSAWGANAVNGVINIITKPAQETQGGMVMGGGGTHEQAPGRCNTAVNDEQAQLRSRMELSHNLTWNVNAYFVGALPAQFVPAYTRLDSQLTWQPEERLELSLVGQTCSAITISSSTTICRA